MLVDQNCQLMGNTSVFTNYLTKTIRRLNSYMPNEHIDKIEQKMNWFQAVMRPCIQRLIKAVVGPKVFGLERCSGDELEATKAAVLNTICKRLEQMFTSEVKFLVSSNEPTVVDFVYYNEIIMALFLMKIKGFKRNFPKTERWITFMNEVSELNECADRLAEIIDNYELE